MHLFFAINRITIKEKRKYFAMLDYSRDKKILSFEINIVNFFSDFDNLLAERIFDLKLLNLNLIP